MASSTSNQPPVNEELQLLKYHEQELVNALSEVDLLDFSRKMQENVVITGEQAETFASLDHDRLDRLKSLTVSMLKGVELVLEHCPALIVDYCQTYFSPDLSQWRSLLDLLLQNCLSAGRPSNFRHPAASPMTVSHSTLTPPLPTHTSPPPARLSPSLLTPPPPRSLSPTTSTHLVRQSSPLPELHMFVSL